MEFVSNPRSQSRGELAGSSYVPNVPNGENITVAQLLKMRSGLYGYTADPALAAAMDADPGRGLVAGAPPTRRPPGKRRPMTRR
jgi:CubicO group peptidase (beta-lactamase class C family)